MILSFMEGAPMKEWEKMVEEAAEEAYDLLNSDKRRA